MSEVAQVQVEEALQHYKVPHLDRNLLGLAAVESIAIKRGRVTITIELGFPVDSIKSAIEQSVVELVSAIDGVTEVNVHVKWKVIATRGQQNHRSLEKVKNIIAVASGKGGVGKSTTAVNMALALLKDGAKVGLLDADIYGPSQQMMLGVPQDKRPDQQDQKFLMPVEAYGLKTMSMGYLTTDKTPVVWRGPMAGGALNQLLTQTWWGDLDYLIIDMPPGTGDIQLTLSQTVSLAGAVIVTTPQDIALIDAQKAVEMFRKVEVPVLGVVENMSIHICSNCGHQEPIFGEGAANQIVKDYAVPMLGTLPLSLQIREQLDKGTPTVQADPDGEIAALYGNVARNTAAQLSLKVSSGPVQVFPNIVINED